MSRASGHGTNVLVGAGINPARQTGQVFGAARCSRAIQKTSLRTGLAVIRRKNSKAEMATKTQSHRTANGF